MVYSLKYSLTLAENKNVRLTTGKWNPEWEKLGVRRFSLQQPHSKNNSSADLGRWTASASSSSSPRRTRGSPEQLSAQTGRDETPPSPSAVVPAPLGTASRTTTLFPPRQSPSRRRRPPAPGGTKQRDRGWDLTEEKNKTKKTHFNHWFKWWESDLTISSGTGSLSRIRG